MIIFFYDNAIILCIPAQSNIVKIWKVYDAFLVKSPLSFGYWKKYADHEGRLDGVNKVFEVYEWSVLAVIIQWAYGEIMIND